MEGALRDVVRTIVLSEIPRKIYFFKSAFNFLMMYYTFFNQDMNFRGTEHISKGKKLH